MKSREAAEGKGWPLIGELLWNFMEEVVAFRSSQIRINGKERQDGIW